MYCANRLRTNNVGAESGSQHMLDRIKKQQSVEESPTAAKRAAAAGVALSYGFIAGFPGEGEQDFKATVAVLKRLSAARKLVH